LLQILYLLSIFLGSGLGFLSTSFVFSILLVRFFKFLLQFFQLFTKVSSLFVRVRVRAFFPFLVLLYDLCELVHVNHYRLADFEILFSDLSFESRCVYSLNPLIVGVVRDVITELRVKILLEVASRCSKSERLVLKLFVISHVDGSVNFMHVGVESPLGEH
jgi:hypothetical protein